MLLVVLIVLLMVSFVALPLYIIDLLNRKPRPVSLVAIGGAIAAVAVALFRIDAWSLLNLTFTAIGVLGILHVVAATELTFRRLWPSHGETFVCAAVLSATFCCSLMCLASAL